MGGSGDDFLWEGLACPPLEDDAFDFLNTPTSVLDDLLDNTLLDIQEDQDKEFNQMVTNKSAGITRRMMNTKANVGAHPYGKGKELIILRQLLPVEASLDYTNQGVGVHGKEDYDLMRWEGMLKPKAVESKRGVKINGNSPAPRYGNHGKGKEIRAMNMNVGQIKAFLGEKDGVEEHKHKKRRIMDCNDAQPMLRNNADKTCLPMKRKDITSLDHTNPCDVGKKRKVEYSSKPRQIKNMTGLGHTNQTAVSLENMRIVDYESRFEASRQMLHTAYGQDREAKEQKHIQVISFQKPEQSGSKGKAKGKLSFRQRVMAMGTRKSNKKFPPYKMLCSCNH